MCFHARQQAQLREAQGPLLPQAPPTHAPLRPAGRFGNWVAADAAEAARLKQRARKEAAAAEKQVDKVAADAITSQAAVGKGGRHWCGRLCAPPALLGRGARCAGGRLCSGRAPTQRPAAAPAAPAGLSSVLGLLKDSGQLAANITWGGRTNDSVPVALIGLDDVYTGGRNDDRWVGAARSAAACLLACVLAAAAAAAAALLLLLLLLHGPAVPPSRATAAGRGRPCFLAPRHPPPTPHPAMQHPAPAPLAQAGPLGGGGADQQGRVWARDHPQGALQEPLLRVGGLWRQEGGGGGGGARAGADARCNASALPLAPRLMQQLEALQGRRTAADRR
jgi:hypothetical protein